MAAVTSIMRAQQIYMARVDEVLRPFELTFSRYELLMLLYFSRVGSMPLSRVGARLQVHPTSVTNAVDRLEAQQLIRRVPHPVDRRTTLAEIQPAGRELAERATAALNEEVFVSPGLVSEDVEALTTLIGRMRWESGDFVGESVSSRRAKQVV
jgi:DNA-binding MarR family transcriptional regulator